MNTRSIALIGLSGVGKSTVGRELAAHTGLPLLDTDALIVEQTNQSIAALFAAHGEAHFRDLEMAALRNALERGPAIIATGGGIVLREANRALLREHCHVVWLDAPTSVLAARLRAHNEQRPLLAADFEMRLEALRLIRAPLYRALAAVQVDTGEQSMSDLVQKAVGAVGAGLNPAPTAPTAPLTITTPAGSYQILVGSGLLATLPEHLTQLGLNGRVWLVSDAAVYAAFGEPLVAQLRAAGRTLESYRVPSGEGSKSLAQAEQLFTWLIGGGVERRDVLLALGGGVIGDLAGFVAATTLRGIAFIQLPTTLLAMVDSAIGGKTGINHPLGKNLIGAFHQPRLVLSDTDTLATLPARERNAGWAEVIKHGVIRDITLFERLENLVDERRKTKDGSLDLSPSIFRLSSDTLAATIQRAARVKVDVVNIDEREMGERMLLNYGHTLGHAIEAAMGYGTLLHGEAVAIGMELAGRIALSLGMWPESDLIRQRRLLHAYGLPTAIPSGLDPEALIERTLRDKKVSAGRIRWVLPTAIGTAITRNDVPEVVVMQVLAAG